jgi:serine/threonine-protein kinase
MMDTPARLASALEGRYRIEREVGAGGWATVYLAHDLRHDRKVALKVLRPELSAILGGDRFLAEIKTTANLQHPHILSLFDSGDADGLVFYVMPFVDGESLRGRLKREKQLPVEEAVRIAREVADALEYAHQKGIVHRDIKPENILLHGGHALVADFGIALAASRGDAGTRMTETGMSLGTPAYMAPEQAMGEREITARADIYALGCVLYEMLVGEPPFTGPTAQAIVARVMTADTPALMAQRKSIPEHVEAAVLRALEKLPADRFASAAQFAEALVDERARSRRRSAAGTGRVAAARRRWVAVLPWALAAVAAGIGAWGWLRPRSAPPPPVTKFALTFDRLGQPQAATGQIAISPDGSMIAYTGTDEAGHSRFFVRHMDREVPVLVPGTEGATYPFFSADGNWLAFVSRGRLWRIPVAGGREPVEICAVWEFRGGAWGPDDRIVYSATGSLYRVSAAGGTPERLASPDTAAGQSSLRSPSLAGDGRTLLASVRSTRGEQHIMVMRLADRKVKQLALPGLQAFLVRGRTLVFVDSVGGLFAIPFDDMLLHPVGDATRILDGVATTASGSVAAVSPTGAIAYVGSSAGADRELVLVDRGGQVRALPAGLAAWSHPRFSPDGRRLAIAIDTRGPRGDIWTWDIGAQRLARLTYDSLNTRPVWSPDGRYIYFSRVLGPNNGIARVRSDGSAPPESLLAWRNNIWEMELTPDLRRLLFRDDDPTTLRDIYWARPESLLAAQVLLGSPLDERTITISPDGRYFAYVSNASGDDEVYLRRLAAESSTWPVSNGGGLEPRWARSGRELFFRRGDSLYVVPVSLGAEPVIGPPRALFGGRYEASIAHSFYDVAPDGNHFAMVRTQGAEGDLVIHVVQNWFEQPGTLAGAPRN